MFILFGQPNQGLVLDKTLEDDSLVVALILLLRLDSIGATRTLLTTFDAALPAYEAAGSGFRFGV
jgi:hypothetical protein